MKRYLQRFSVLGLAFALLAAAAGAGGFARVYPIAGTELSVTNLEQNAVWRPCVVSVLCTNTASRGVTVSRIYGTNAYPIGATTVTAQYVVYEFPANYWCTLSNGWRVTVSPAVTGSDEVIYE
jgi:hypothetical protein